MLSSNLLYVRCYGNADVPRHKSRRSLDVSLGRTLAVTHSRWPEMNVSESRLPLAITIPIASSVQTKPGLKEEELSRCYAT